MRRVDGKWSGSPSLCETVHGAIANQLQENTAGPELSRAEMEKRRIFIPYSRGPQRAEQGLMKAELGIA